MAPPIHLGAWSMALMLWLPFELLLVCLMCVLQLKNFKTAASFARRLLELGPKSDIATQVCCKTTAVG